VLSPRPQTGSHIGVEKEAKGACIQSDVLEPYVLNTKSAEKKADYIRGHIARLGEATLQSPLDPKTSFITDDQVVLLNCEASGADGVDTKLTDLDLKYALFERAGARAKVFYEPSKVRVAMVTCGGICPGLNNVIREIVLVLWYGYGVRSITGLKYGYAGLNKELSETIQLEPHVVKNINRHGGSLLGTSRGPQQVPNMVDFLVENKYDILFTIGGDGTLTGASEIAKEIINRKLDISVIGLPKTIDNDIVFTDRTFGFETAVLAAQTSIHGAHVESRSVYNGVGLVKLMGRESGFIALQASLASGVVNALLIPEVSFNLEKLTEYLVSRLKENRHAVIVIAEGAGQDLCNGGNLGKDKSGNAVFGDIGTHLKKELTQRLTERGMDPTIKYIDPSYEIRSGPANANDAVYCLRMAHAAVHAAMSGRTGMMVSEINGHFVHVPLDFIVGKRKKVNPYGPLYQTLLHCTGMPTDMA